MLLYVGVGTNSDIFTLFN